MLAEQSVKRIDIERLRRLAEARSLADAYKMLGDYGYTYAEGCTVDGFIVAQTDALIAFVSEYSPTDALKNALTARFVYNNAKLAYKSRLRQMPSDGYYSVDFDAKKIADGDYSEADPFMAAALERLDEQKQTDPVNIDLELTRAMYAYVCSCKIPAVVRYFRTEIDCKNILTAARMRRLALSGDEFVAGGKLDMSRLRESLDAESFADCFDGTPYADYARAIEDGGFAELWQAERDADGLLYGLTERAVTEYGSLLPFLRYYHRTLVELKTVKTLLVSVKTGARDAFYKRIPLIYG